MLNFKTFLSEDISQSQLNSLEKTLDKLFSALSIDIEFTRHFLDRANDDRNQEPIKIGELEKIFRDTFKKHGTKIVRMNPNAEAVLKDLQTNINIPFALHINPRTQLLELISKTVMRKKNFQTRNQQLKV